MILTPFHSRDDKERRMEASLLFIVFYLINFVLVRKLPELLATVSAFNRLAIPHKHELASSFIQLACLLLTLFILKKRNFHFSNLKSLFRPQRVIAIIIIAVVLIQASDMLSEWLKGIYFPDHYTMEQLPLTERLILLAMDLVPSVILAPVVEEFLFRGLLLKYVFARYQIAGLIISTILFILAHHPQNWTSWLFFGTPGLVLGIVYLLTKQLKVPIFIHSTINFIALLKLNLF